ncbi:unnamed protein product [Colias eurytheme]|nr:unnamed protein product [Colias eurytheme]
MTVNKMMLFYWLASSVFVIVGADDTSNVTTECGASTDLNNSQLIDAPKLLLAQRNGVVLVDGDIFENITFATTAAGVDYHYRNNLLFWSDDYYTYKVYVQLLNESTIIRNLTVSGGWGPVALAVDWVGDKLYVVDQLGNKVHVFELDGSWQNVVLDTNLTNPTDIALDPLRGLMFVADDKKIIRANMDGTDVKTIVSEYSAGYHLFGVAVDTQKKRLYYCIAALDFIESVDYNGENKLPIVKVEPNLYYPVRLATFKNKVFWSDSLNQTIFSVDEYQGSSSIRDVYKTDANKEYRQPKSLAILHPLKQTSVDNPCGNDNGGCSQMCIVTSLPSEEIGFSCVCHAGYILNNDLKTCMPAKEFLVYTRKTIVQGKVIDPSITDTHDSLYVDVSDNTRFVGLDFDSRNGQIYYSDIIDQVMYSINKNGTDKEKVSDLQNVGEGLAFDWMSQNLYYTTAYNGSVNVLCTQNGAHKSNLISGLAKPRAIVVYPRKGLIFVSDWGSDRAKVIRANSDGGGMFIFKNIKFVWPNGLSIDFEEDRLYWADGELKHIQHSTLDGKDVKTINSDYIKHPFSIVVHKQYLYFTDWKQNAIIRLHKLNGKEEEIISKVPSKDRSYGIKYYSEDAQRMVSNHPCYGNNNKCQKLCFAIENNNTRELFARCACPDEEVLDIDGYRCVSEDLVQSK